VIGGAPLLELYVAILLIVGGVYWWTVQRHHQVEPQVEAPEPKSPMTIGGP
jgi:hypothetical protein